MRSNLWTFIVVALVIVGAVAAGAMFFEPKNDGPFERIGEKLDKAVK